MRLSAAAVALTLISISAFARAAEHAPEAPLGYYRFPAVSGETVVFTAEGDLWRVPIAGGEAKRLTSHLGEESRAAISPDGRWVAFSAAYDGPVEVYVMPLDGGLPRRLTWDGLRAAVQGWTPDGKVIYASRIASGLPNSQLFTIDPATARREPIPLAQASQGAYAGKTLVFTRFDTNISNTKRYRGGFLQQLWVWGGGRDEARRLVPQDSAASRSPMVWNDRIYFVGDRDLTMNLWSVKLDGSDPVQHTRHKGFDVLGTSLSNGRIVYQLGADLRVYDIAANRDAAIPIRLSSDLDQERERWVKKPLDLTSALHLAANGDRVVATARGQVFVLPVKTGRIVEASRRPGVRYRQARFMPDGKTLLALSEESGEVEFWKLPANGVGRATQLTKDARMLRWNGVPSPDGKWIATNDKNQILSLVDAATGRSIAVDSSDTWTDIQDLRWSPDSRWLAYAKGGPNLQLELWIYDTVRRQRTAVTSDRTDSWSPAWSPDGKWLWFLSDRHFESTVQSIWGSRQPDPFFDQRTKIYGVALQSPFRSPFDPVDELHPAETKSDEAKPAAAAKTKPADAKGTAAGTAKPVEITLAGLSSRLIEVPTPPGNFSDLATDGSRLYFLSASTAVEPKNKLQALAIGRDGDDATTVMDDVTSYELSGDGKKLMVRKKDDLYVFDAAGKAPGELDKTRVPMADWTFSFDPRIEWRQMFTEAWRLERDYFYDPAMHGVDWKTIRERYQPLADRVTDRAELADVFQQMIGELTALHMYVYGGDLRQGLDPANPGALGATLARDEAAGGFRIARILPTDPDWPDEASPLARPGLDVRPGDVIQSVNGEAALSVPDIQALLRNQSGKQVLLRVARAGATHDVLVQPVNPSDATALRYRSWEYERRSRVDSLGGGRIGYVHLQAMGPDDIAKWMREYYPVFDRDGLIIDVRHNNGGNIDSWILGKLLRRNWFYWQPRVGHPFGNMPYAFRGPMCVIADERTVSDGEAFAEGFRRLGLGKVVGTRTLGGEIWLSSDNFLVDHGIATAAETGVFGLEGSWIIENHGVDPDIVVDDLPRATYDGADAQLDAAVRVLLDELKQHPLPKIETPRYPVKGR
jgi:tricorn protease